ncbi:MAG: hypothetical protein NTX22_00390 [Ignavibacteriales bacterium]|nr:hypothetical protein [Ignavibacteriales bacterium]
MISAFIFFAHLIFITYIFTKKWQTESLSAAFVNAALIIILFTVGWSITGMIAKALMEKQGFGLYFDRDTFSLTLLAIGELFFFRMYYGKDVSTLSDTEIQ